MSHRLRIQAYAADRCPLRNCSCMYHAVCGILFATLALAHMKCLAKAQIVVSKMAGTFITLLQAVFS